jgi:hydroxybutyrate-dimer hydrolase
MGIHEKAAKFVGTILASVSLAFAAHAAGPRAHTTVIHNSYDGKTNDLLTAGLGRTGLASATFPGTFSTPPTTDELRKYAIYNNYRALIDPTPTGGFGLLYGPNIAPDGIVTNSEGMIAGDEYITFEKDGQSNVTLMVHIPSSFDPKNACIITAPSSGSRGMYGAIATAGEWGLKHGCVVAYTDKGAGNGIHDLQNDKVNLIQGQQVTASQASDNAIFKAKLSAAELASFNAATPNRFAFEHAHSQQNPEKDWGQNVLTSIRFAFEILEQKYGRGKITKRNTIVIASSVSNGGGASIRAAEQDLARLIDGVAVGEPNVNPIYSSRFTIQQGQSAPLINHSRRLIDYVTFVNVFQRCANGAPANAAAPLNAMASLAPTACANLHQRGLLVSKDTTVQANEAQKIINDFGILVEQNLVQPGYWTVAVPRSISVTYANAYGRFSVKENLCNYSFALAIDAGKSPSAPDPMVEARLFGNSNGIPPQSGVSFLINNATPEGTTKEDAASTPDQNLDGALCLRSIAIGKDAASGAVFLANDPRSGFARRIKQGTDEILTSGRLNGIPTLIVTGRNDGILPPNFTSRAYYGLNMSLEPRNQTRYYEITNAHHLDTLNQVPAYGALYIPLHRYYLQALDLMYSHLTQKTTLPPSQVVRTVPRGTGAPQIAAANVPPINQKPAPADLITFAAGKLSIPD